MRTTRFLLIVSIVTILSLLYVHQQLTLVKLSYRLKDNQKKYSNLLDQNKIIKYNIACLKSPKKVEDALAAENIKLVMPPVWQVVKIAGEESSNRRLASNDSGSRTSKGLFSFLSLKGVAVAGTIDDKE